MAYLDILTAAARVVGGSLSDVAHSPPPTGTAPGILAPLLPYWYSGRDMGDGTGVSGLTGCFAVPPEVVPFDPIAMILPGTWARSAGMPSYPLQGKKYDEDIIVVRIMVGHDDVTQSLLRLVNFRDTVPTAFDTHMQMFSSAGVVTADCADGRFIETEWPSGTAYFALEFYIHIERDINIIRQP